MEHSNKIKSKSSSSQVSAVSTSSEENIKENNDKKEKVNVLLVEINKLNAKVSELSSMRDEIRELKQQLSSGYNNDNEKVCLKSGDDSHRRPRRIFKCRSCEGMNKAFCNHCWSCGASDHRKSDCKNTKNE